MDDGVGENIRDALASVRQTIDERCFRFQNLVWASPEFDVRVKPGNDRVYRCLAGRSDFGLENRRKLVRKLSDPWF